MDEKEIFVAEIAKQLPIEDIYDDLAHPALSTVGQALQGATRVALSPIFAMVWAHDKIAGYLSVALPQYFEERKIAKEKIKSPDPAIAVPLIEAMRYTSHKEELREMFTNLLGASMNSDVVDEHPAFVEIIKQLSSDECKMIKYLHEISSIPRQYVPMLKIRQKINDGGVDLMPYFSDICYITGCQYPKKFPVYLDNLHRLGLVEVFYDRFLINEEFYIKLKEHKAFPHFLFDEEDILIEKKGMYGLSEFGEKFCAVCLG
ncbi:DUF4393 domain-containing protein [Clostridium sp. MD294]|uniref:DUF4393 domain-containing protein n=1 Tax=Clostridium sp. MD294 TaxID=97138 RepID=UPI0002C99A14|nr:DUF4393 domain-containing protein [Clostridium sp. MD294]USF29798.1 hypothetical protein C820_001206 [Clostridium sp. MD294]